MTDEIALSRAMALAAHAQTLMEDEILQGAFDELEASYIKAWRGTQARDTDARERLWQAVQVVGKVRDHLANIVAGGKLAKRELEDLAGNFKPFRIL